MKYNKSLRINYYDYTEALEIFEGIRERNERVFTGSRKSQILDISCAFDIETTSYYHNSFKMPFMYAWMFCIVDDSTGEYFPFLGREWWEFDILKHDLEEVFVSDKENRKARYLVPVFIHNASFEFGFMRGHYKIGGEDVFAVKSQTPLYFRTGGVEFRCSYLLSGVGLKDLPTSKWHKQDGDLDYNKIRHGKTTLDDTETGYCLGDVLTLCDYISLKRGQDGGIGGMCYTKTGYARRGLAEHCMGTDRKHNEKRTNYIKDALQPLAFHSSREYQLQKLAYQGGHTAACPYYSRKVLKDVTCFDFTSSYPAVMVCEDRFPREFYDYKPHMTKKEYEDYISAGFAIVSAVHYKGVRQKAEFDSWIPLSKVYLDKNTKEEKKKIKENNGKLYSYEGGFSMFITNIDYDVYNFFYEFDEVEFSSCYIYKTGYLPKCVIEYVLDLYKDKTTLKGVKGQELLYMLKKELLNALYGMAVTDPCRDEIGVNEETGEWKTRKLTDEEVEEEVQKYNEKLAKGKIATPYIWGVYVSALARYNLALGILASGSRKMWAYGDTDSIYVTHADKLIPWIESYNRNVEQKMLKMCNHYGFQTDCWRPKTVKGVEKPLGYWDFDGHYKLFKALGAKRYIKETDEGEIITTVAGLGKEAGAEYLKETYKTEKRIFNAFDDELEVPADKTGKLTHTYVTAEYIEDVTDYMGITAEVHCIGGVHLEKASFSLSMTEVYMSFLLGLEEKEGR